MTLKTNLDASCDCGGACCSGGQNRMHSQFASGARRETFLGVEHLVVPVIMLQEIVVNGGLVRASELKPLSWNGVPVTIGHPEVNGVTVPANSPKVLEQWQVGRIFNATLDGKKLKAEAWVEINRAEQVRPGIIALLEAGPSAQMDVSTGYFSTDVFDFGVFNGEPFNHVQFDIKPDHLALLPDEVGACSWADGCGVRANRKESIVSNASHTAPDGEQELAGIRRFFTALGGKNNRRGADDDMRQMVADLISNDGTPFVPDDEFSLRELTPESLRELRDKFLAKEKPTTNQKDSQMADDKTAATDAKTNSVEPVTAEQVQEIVANAIAGALSDSVTKAVDHALNANKRADLIEAIHANTEVAKEELEKLSTNALEAMAPKANAVRPTDYTGKGMKKNGDDGTNTVKFPGMATNRKAASEGAGEKKEA